MLYEDDFEFEEQPADLRDRAIGGKPGGGRGGGGRRGREPRQAPSRPQVRQEMPEDAKPARDLLREILEGMGIGSVDINYIARKEGEYLEITGPHLGMLIGRHGNTLEALNLLFNNAFNWAFATIGVTTPSTPRATAPTEPTSSRISRSRRWNAACAIASRKNSSRCCPPSAKSSI